MEKRILNSARDLFFNYGIKSITMDDLAKQIGISKKTVYLHFKDKNEIVHKIIGDLIQKHNKEVESCQLNAENAIEEVILQDEILNQLFSGIKPNIFFELEKYFPETANEVNIHKKECLLKGIKANIDRGIKEGLYRQDISSEILAESRLHLIYLVFNGKNFSSSEYDIKTVLKELNEFYLNGICTEKGRELITTYLNQHI